MQQRVLIVEDNADIRAVIATHLQEANFDVAEVGAANDAMMLVGVECFDVVILDITLPDGNGLEVCRKLRGLSYYTPVIMLSARDSEADRILGLEIGADDYVTKPFSVSELVARARAQVRRSVAYADDLEVVEVEGLRIDSGKRQVLVDGAAVELTSLEFDLLSWFASQPGRVFSRSQLLDNVWGVGYEGYEHTVNTHINRLRGKIERDPGNPGFIKTIWGVGYAFQIAG